MSLLSTVNHSLLFEYIVSSRVQACEVVMLLNRVGHQIVLKVPGLICFHMISSERGLVKSLLLPVLLNLSQMS
jgi:hypothetical protein